MCSQVAVKHVKETAVHLNRFFAVGCTYGARGVLEAWREVGTFRQEVRVLLTVLVFRVRNRAYAGPDEVVTAAQFE